MKRVFIIKKIESPTIENCYWSNNLEMFSYIRNATQYITEAEAQVVINTTNKIPEGMYQVISIICKSKE